MQEAILAVHKFEMSFVDHYAKPMVAICVRILM